MTTGNSVIFCSVLNGDGSGEDLEPPYDAGDAQEWAHLDLTAADARGWLQKKGVDDQAIDTLTAKESRPRAFALDDGLLTVLRGVNRNAGEDPEDMVSIRIWLTERSIFTIRQRKVRAAAEVHDLLLTGKGPANATAALVMVVEHLASGAADFIDKIESRVDQYEDNIDKIELSDARSEVASARREIASVRRYLQPQRAALETLGRQGGRWFDDDQMYAMRELADQFLRFVEDLDLLRERTLVLQEEIMSRTSQEQNDRMYLLSIVATIFLPITFISGVFGMNVAGLPGLDNSVAFLAVSGVMLVLSIAIIIWLRIKHWF